jgi:hypothetical protein
MLVRHSESRSAVVVTASSNDKYLPGVRRARLTSLMHNTQGAARSAPHVDTHVHVRSGTPVEICGFLHLTGYYSFACGVSAPDLSKSDEYLHPFTDESRSHANLVKYRQRFAVRFVRLVEQACRITRPQQRSRVATLVAGRRCPCCCATLHVLLARTHSHTRTHPGPDVTVSGCFGPHMRLVL